MASAVPPSASPAPSAPQLTPQPSSPGTSSGTFSATSSATSSGTSSRTSSGTSSGTSSRSSSSSTPPSSHSSTNTGAIAGGVAGGIACLAIIGGLIAWYLLRKRRSSNAKIMNTTQNLDYPQPSYYPQTTQTKLYSPSDPSTFPPSTEEMLIDNSRGKFSPLLPGMTVQPGRGQYSGAPEL